MSTLIANQPLDERLGEVTLLAQHILQHNTSAMRVFYGDRYPSGVARPGDYLFVLVDQSLNIGAIERDDELAQRKQRIYHERTQQELGIKAPLDIFSISIYFQNIIAYAPFLGKLFRSAAFEYDKRQEKFLVRPTDKPHLRIVPRSEDE